MVINCKPEPTLDELLSDSMMPLVYDRYRITADEVRAIMRKAAARLARPRRLGKGQALPPGMSGPTS